MLFKRISNQHIFLVLLMLPVCAQVLAQDVDFASLLEVSQPETIHNASYSLQDEEVLSCTPACGSVEETEMLRLIHLMPCGIQNRVDIEGYLSLETSTLLEGGENPGATAFRNYLELSLSSSMDRWGFNDWDSGSFTISFRNLRGDFGGTDTGDILYYNFNDNDFDFTQLGELYFEQLFLDDTIRVKIGKVDSLNEFQVKELNDYVLGSGLFYNPTTYDLMPTYPNPAMSFNFFYQPNDDFYIGYGIYDGRQSRDIRIGRQGPEFGGPYWMVLESGVALPEWGITKLMVGVWHQTDDFERFDNAQIENGQSGIYASLEQQIIADPCDLEKGLFWAFGYGRGEDQVNTLPESFSISLVSKNYWYLLSEENSWAANVVTVDAADTPDYTGGRETQFEIVGSMPFTERLIIHPAVTYIDNPIYAVNSNKAMVGTLRVEVSF